MSASNRLIVLVRTYGGTACKVAVLVAAAIVDPSGTAVAAIKAAIDAITTGKLVGGTISQPGNYTTTSASGPYEDDQDKCDFTFKDAVGQYHTYRIPAPLDTIFQDGTDKLDLTNSAVTTFAGYVTSNCVSLTGAALTSLVSGRRIRLRSGSRV